MITSDQVDNSPLGLYFINILVHVAANYAHIYKARNHIFLYYLWPFFTLLYIDDARLHDLMCETTNVTLEWYHLGLALGLLQRTLDVIKTQSADLRTCQCTMLAEWLKQKDQVLQKGRPSWRTLVKALRSSSVNRVDVANDIAKKHKVTVIDLT